MSDDCPPMPQPTDEHRELAEMVGTWKVACTYFMDPSQPPMECSATETCEMTGPFWLTTRFDSVFGGMPFVGRCTVGYLPQKQKWISTWVDSMSPWLFHFEGERKDGVLHMQGEGPSPMTGEMTTFRTEERALDDGNRSFDMFVALPGGQEARMFHYVYSRP